MKVETNTSVRFYGEGSTRLIVRHTNRGEPYREGIEFDLELGTPFTPTVFLNEDEARSIRDLLNRLYPEKK